MFVFPPCSSDPAALDTFGGDTSINYARNDDWSSNSGVAATLGDAIAEGGNAFIWAAWAHLESKRGNVKAARKLFDASTAADSHHAAAWHGWGLMEKREGNIVRARDVWMQVRPSPTAILLATS